MVILWPLGDIPPPPFFLLLLHISQNIAGFRQNKSQGFLEFIIIYKQNPLKYLKIFSLFTKAVLPAKGNSLALKEGNVYFFSHTLHYAVNSIT